MPFKPGQSGNPGGRPREAPDIKRMAREHADKAVAALVAALDDPRQRVAAATALLDRGYGKPAQAITGADGGALKIDNTHTFPDAGLAALNEDELDTVTTLLEKAAGAGSPAVN